MLSAIAGQASFAVLFHGHLVLVLIMEGYALPVVSESSVSGHQMRYTPMLPRHRVLARIHSRYIVTQMAVEELCAEWVCVGSHAPKKVAQHS